jgi:ERCC4-related helicase
MGAGKTAITLTAIRDMVRDKVATKFLVLAPKRVATDVWPVEAAKWTPELSVAVCAGTVKQRLRALYADKNIIVANYD